MSRDPELLKALDMAKRLGKKQPAHMVYRPRNPTFDLAPARIRRMANPKASTLSCSASVYRNLSGFGSGTGENNCFLKNKIFLHKHFRHLYQSEAAN